VPRAAARFGQRAVTETMMSGDDNDLTTLLENHPWLFEMRPAIESIANTDAHVLIHGESGRMCKLVARAIHAASGHHDRPFPKVDCSDCSRRVECNLFGVEGRTRTGKMGRKLGLLEIPEGTLYLEHIASLPLALQAKLLQVLHDRRVPRGQREAPMPLMVRVIAATNWDFGHTVARGEFLEELYRLFKEISAPPLTREERDRAAAEQEEWARLERAWRKPIDRHNEACRGFARTGAAEGLICPHCRRRSREDIEFVDYTGSRLKSFFVCRSCGRSFGHEL
jgi:DNA-binding NtrC family response regulator